MSMMAPTLTTLEHERESHVARSAPRRELPARNRLSQPAYELDARAFVGLRHARRIRQHADLADATATIDRNREREHAGERDLRVLDLASELVGAGRELARREWTAHERTRLHEPAVDHEPAGARIARARDRS